MEWLTAYHEALARLEANDIAAATAGFARVIDLRTGSGDRPAAFFLDQLRSGGVAEGGIVTLLEK